MGTPGGGAAWRSGPQVERSRPLEARGGDFCCLNHSTDFRVEAAGRRHRPPCKHLDRAAEQGRKWEAGRMNLADSRLNVSEPTGDSARHAPQTHGRPAGEEVRLSTLAYST